MIELTAQGPEHGQVSRIRRESGASAILGRDSDCELSVPWDACVSRRHAQLTFTPEGVRVERLPAAANPVCVAGARPDSATVVFGGFFVIGSTKFHVARDLPSPSAGPVEELTFDRQALRKIRFRDADKRIDVLSHLPELIWGARTEAELHHRLSNLILAGVLHADAVAIVRSGDDENISVLHWERRLETAGDFRPSGRLITESLARRQRSVLHVWESDPAASPDYTAVAEFDWAFCTPVTESAGTPWGLYVAGKLDRPLMKAGTDDTDGVHLQADVKFAELVAEIISSVRRLNRLERQQASLSQFFAPSVMELLADNPEALNPCECNATVLFCDLRGFSQRAEGAADDLRGLLDRVSLAFEVMRNEILEHSGTPCDFQGDAALGFWGWPFPSDEDPLNACRAALGIRAAFDATRGRKDHPLADFQMGIGIAHGQAVAGKLGASEQVKISVFGPVVNLAARLETMTKQLRVPILLDEATAEFARKGLPSGEGRVRKLAKVLPYGMKTPLMVTELLPSAEAYAELTDAHVAQYERGVEHFTAGRWEEAYNCLHGMPAGDRAQDFLAMHIAQHNRIAPPNWDGVVRLPTK